MCSAFLRAEAYRWVGRRFLKFDVLITWGKVGRRECWEPAYMCWYIIWMGPQPGGSLYLQCVHLTICESLHREAMQQAWEKWYSKLYLVYRFAATYPVNFFLRFLLGFLLIFIFLPFSFPLLKVVKRLKMMHYWHLSTLNWLLPQFIDIEQREGSVPISISVFYQSSIVYLAARESHQRDEYCSCAALLIVWKRRTGKQEDVRVWQVIKRPQWKFVEKRKKRKIDW